MSGPDPNSIKLDFLRSDLDKPMGFGVNRHPTHIQTLELNAIKCCNPSPFMTPRSHPFQHTPSPCVKTLLAHSKTLSSLHQIHSQIILQGHEQDTTLISRFLNTLFTTNTSTITAYADAVFRRVPHPDLVLWNTLLKGYCNRSSVTRSLHVFVRMRKGGFGVDEFSLPPLIRCCVRENEFGVGRGIHGLGVKNGLLGSVHLGTCLIDFYGKSGDSRGARFMFDEMPEKNEVSWTSMIVVYLELERLGDVRRVCDEMIREGEMRIGVVSLGYVVAWNAMIRGYVRFGDLVDARELFDKMQEKDMVSYTAMVDGYAKSGDMVLARHLFEHCEKKDVFLWSALISGYAQNGHPKEAVDMFLAMQQRNVRPDEHIMVSVISACSKLGDLELAQWIDSYMNSGSFNLRNEHVIAALIDMNAKCGNVERALTLFNNMPRRDLVLYCSMIQGLSAHGQVTKAVSLFYQMLSEGLTPDDVAFTVILNACSRQGLVEEGHRLFELMRSQSSIVPSPDHYACMVDLFGRSGQLRPAFDLIKSMPVEAHVGAWVALLGACKLHCATELGEEVAAQLAKLEPQNAGNYVLLSNIYAAANRWMDVTALRNQIDAQGLKVIAGRSYT